MLIKEKYSIYKITNSITKKVYIGSCSFGFNKRKNVHLCFLRKNKHHSKKLQNSYNKYGEEFFIFSLIEECNKNNILIREQYWIDFYDSYNKGYNATPVAGNCFGREVSEKTRLKISNSLKGRKVVRSKEHNIKLGLTRRKTILLLDLDGNLIKKFSTNTEAANFLGLSQSTISVHCSGLRKNYKFNLKYEN